MGNSRAKKAGEMQWNCNDCVVAITALMTGRQTCIMVIKNIKNIPTIHDSFTTTHIYPGAFLYVLASEIK